MVVDPSNPQQVIRQPADPYADFPTAPKTPKAAVAPASADDPYADFPAEAPKAKELARQVGTGEAIGKGLVEGASFGFAPAISGLAEAAGPEYQPKLDDNGQPVETPNPMAPIVGAAKMLHGYLSGHPDPAVQDAYNRGRQAALDDQALAKEQHPLPYLAGQLGGTVLMPLPGAGAMRAGTAGVRALGGLRAGAVGGGLYGAGEATSEGKSAGDIAKSAGTGAVIGAGLGAGLGAVVGPRAVNAMTPGRQAARTAEIIGAPITKGLASDNRAIQSATSATASVPLIGARVRNAVDQTTHAAGDVVGGSGIDDAIAANRARINNLYDSVRNQIDQNAVAPMPRTDAAVQHVIANRRAAGQPHPAHGLEQFEHLGRNGATFNGMHRARVDAREAGNVLNPHPGYNAADFNMITRAMTGDIRDAVGRLATRSPQRAQRAFAEAETQFGPISEANKFLARIARQRGPGAGLDEIGFNPATGNFSLNKFVTAWNKLNPQIRPFVPTPQHRAAIEAIFQMGTHIKSSLRESNTSHTSTPLIMMDLARDAILGGMAIGTGAMSAVSAVGGGVLAAPVLVFMHWLAQPAVANAMSRWSQLYRVISLGQANPARIAAFNIATRNLAHNLGVPAESIIHAAQRRLAAPAENEDKNNKKP